MHGFALRRHPKTTRNSLPLGAIQTLNGKKGTMLISLHGINRFAPRLAKTLECHQKCGDTAIRSNWIRRQSRQRVWDFQKWCKYRRIQGLFADLDTNPITHRVSK